MATQRGDKRGTGHPRRRVQAPAAKRTLEPFFRQNAIRWATALREAGAEVVMTERVGSHGDAFWREELPLMVAWASGR